MFGTEIIWSKLQTSHIIILNGLNGSVIHNKRSK